jgi:DNA-binding transcriptional LysR family regulator
MGNNMNLELVHIFVQVVKNGSFTKAASLLRLPKSTVSKALLKLEKETATKLLMRTTRSQRLTAAGKIFYDTCAAPMEAIENAGKSLFGNHSAITGTIKLTAPEDFGPKIIALSTSKLCQQYPGLNFELHYTNEILDLVKDGYDLAVRIGKLKSSSLKEKKMGDLSLILVASPKYLKNKPKCTKAQDLLDLDCLALSRPSSNIVWKLKNKTTAEQIPLKPRMVSNQMSSLLSAAMHGGGIALVPAFLCQQYIKSQELVHLLPQWSSPRLPVSLLSPLPFSSSARLRTVADFLATEIKSALL